MPLTIDCRPSKDEWLMLMAWLCSTRATCHKGRAGCVLTTNDGVILSTGYNGPPGHGTAAHCSDVPCSGECVAHHAERNAIDHLDEASRQAVSTAYITCSPCSDCASRLILLPGLRRVCYDHKHHRTEKANAGLSILANAGVSVEEVAVGDPFPEHPLPIT